MIRKTFGKYLKPYIWYCIIGPAAKLLEAILELFLPLFMAQVIDNELAAHNTKTLIYAGLVMLGIVCLGFGSALICQYMASRTSQGFGTELRRDLFDRMMRLSPNQIDGYGEATLTTRLTSDVNQLQYAVAMLIRLVIRAPFLCIGGVVMAASIDWRLALVILAATPVFLGILWLVSRLTVPLHRTVQSKLDKLTGIVSENLSGVRVVRAFARRKAEQSRFDHAVREHTDRSLKAARISALLNPATVLVMDLAILGILGIGNVRVAAGELTTGEIVAFIQYVTQILAALTVTANLVGMYTKAYASACRVAEILHTEPALTDGTGARENQTANAVVFENVGFSYNSGENDLNQISFSVPRGATVGILGGTGSGKSTLLRLMMRFYDAGQGNIRINGADVRDYPLKTLREKFAYVAQKPELFSGTIAQNIRLGAAQATDSDVKAAAEAAQAVEFIESMPKQYESPVERGGANLSGGQRQRLAIARALCRKAEFLLLDDASSALDYATDAALQQAVSQLKSTTVFVVSQRIRAVKHADLLLVMDEGKLIGQGTHEQLMKTCPLYREMAVSQEVIA